MLLTRHKDIGISWSFLRGQGPYQKQGNESHGELKKKSLRERNLSLSKFLYECIIPSFTKAHHLEERMFALNSSTHFNFSADRMKSKTQSINTKLHHTIRMKKVFERQMVNQSHYSRCWQPMSSTSQFPLATYISACCGDEMM